MTRVPLKHQLIAEALAREIRDGRHRVGGRLPGEHALAHRFGVSRTTVRAALAELCEAALITTRTGKGSYVRFDGRPPDDRLGWARAVAADGADTRVRTLAVRELRDDDLSHRLDVRPAEFVCVERIRELAGEGTAVSYERSFLPPVPAVRELVGDEPGPESLSEALLRAGLRPDHGEQRLRARRLDAREAELLRREPGDWFLDTRRTSRAADGSFVEHAVGLLDPDHFELTLTFG